MKKFFLSYLSKPLLLSLSYNHQNRTQTNTVVVQRKEMDRVGFEPTTLEIVSKPVLYDFPFKGQSTSINTIIMVK
jgi:hypothetical protein